MANYTEVQAQYERAVNEIVRHIRAVDPNITQNDLKRGIDVVIGTELQSLRMAALKKYAELCGRNVIMYYSTWVQNFNRINHPELSIVDNDINGLMNVISKCDRGKGLDLILHTPGGSISATTSIVSYLRKIFNGDIRVIVPHMAMSCGTMIACSAKEIIMGKQSSLGPIDPQLRGIAAGGVLTEFKRMEDEIENNPNKILVWREILNKYPPTFLGDCQNAIDLSKKYVKNWLVTGMFLNEKNAKKKANKVLNTLLSHKVTKAHDVHYDYDECRLLGLKVVALEDNQQIQDAILEIHHTYVLSTVKQPNAIKFIESDSKMSTIIRYQG